MCLDPVIQLQTALDAVQWYVLFKQKPSHTASAHLHLYPSNYCSHYFMHIHRRSTSENEGKGLAVWGDPFIFDVVVRLVRRGSSGVLDPRAELRELCQC